MSGPPALVKPESLVQNRPTAPCMWYTQGGQILSLPLVDCEVYYPFLFYYSILTHQYYAMLWYGMMVWVCVINVR
jgi:hypothetical protein